MPKSSRFPPAPFETKLSEQDPRWRKWFEDVWNSIQATAFTAGSVAAAAVGASPFLYQFTGAGQATAVLTGGTVTKVEWSRDAVTFFQIGAATNDSFALSQGDYLRITYTVLPTLTVALR